MHFTFCYDRYGYGWFRRIQDGEETGKWWTRTGSKQYRDGKLTLINNIPVGKWTHREAPVETKEEGMGYDKYGWGWKCRLWNPEGYRTHYLVHPDTGKGGTLGCCGLQNTDGEDLYKFYELVYEGKPHSKLIIPVYITHNPNRIFNKEDDMANNYSIKKTITKSITAGAVAAIGASTVTQPSNVEEILTPVITGLISALIKAIMDYVKNRKK